MRVGMLKTKSQVMAYSNGQAEMYIKGIIKMTNDMELEKWCGQMDPCIVESGEEEFNMVMEE
jgi:hypothetical protein